MRGPIEFVLQRVAGRGVLGLRVPHTMYEVTSEIPQRKLEELRARDTRVAHWRLLNCRALQNLGRRAHERRSFAVFDAPCEICVQCRGFVRHAVSVGPFTAHCARVRRRKRDDGMVVLAGARPRIVVFPGVVGRKGAQISVDYTPLLRSPELILN